MHTQSQQDTRTPFWTKSKYYAQKGFKKLFSKFPNILFFYDYCALQDCSGSKFSLYDLLVTLFKVENKCSFLQGY